MKEKLGRWIKTIERLPGLNDKVQWRLNGEERDGTETIAEVTFLGAAAFAKYEWKDESPTTADASVLINALEKIQTMKLEPGETDYKYAFNRCWHIATDALAQYSTQSLPESQESKGGEEDELWMIIVYEVERLRKMHDCESVAANFVSKYHITKK